MINQHIAKAQEILDNTDALIIASGAGMGVDSGLPDFRGNEGFWKAYPPIKKLGLTFVEMANPRWFDDNPRLAWGFYGHRLNLYRATVPHHGFTQLLHFAQQLEGGYFVVTSNVDGQFQKAGFDTRNIYEVHGSIHHFQCAHRCTNGIWNADQEHLNVNPETFQAEGKLPQCPNCGQIARPNILMFNDWQWCHQRSTQQAERFEDWLRRNLYKNITIIETGAGHHVPTIRHTSENIVHEYQANLIRINPRDYDVPQGQIPIESTALEGIQQLLGSH